MDGQGRGGRGGVIDRHDRDEVQNAAAVAALFMPDLVKYLQTLVSLVMIMLGWVTLALEVFLRRDFGERYLSWVRIILAWIVLSTFFVFAITIGSIFGEISRLLVLFVVGFAILCLFHRIQIWRRNRRRAIWHSMSFGINWFAPVWERMQRALQERGLGGLARYFDDWTFFRLIEPLFCLWLAFLVRFIDPIMAIWLGLSGLALLLKNNLIYNAMYSRFLDLMDAKIEAGFYSEALAGKPKGATAGFSVVSLPPQVRRVAAGQPLGLPGERPTLPAPAGSARSVDDALPVGGAPQARVPAVAPGGPTTPAAFPMPVAGGGGAGMPPSGGGEHPFLALSSPFLTRPAGSEMAPPPLAPAGGSSAADWTLTLAGVERRRELPSAGADAGVAEGEWALITAQLANTGRDHLPVDLWLFKVTTARGERQYDPSARPAVAAYIEARGAVAPTGLMLAPGERAAVTLAFDLPPAQPSGDLYLVFEDDDQARVRLVG